MLILVDECMPQSFVTELRKRQHDVVWARERYQGYKDEDILALATGEGRIVLTEDRDFGRLAVRYNLPAVGIVLVQVSQLPGTAAEIATYVADTIDKLSDTCIGSFTVIGPGRTRQRPL